jgi:hypothetical protein
MKRHGAALAVAAMVLMSGGWIAAGASERPGEDKTDADVSGALTDSLDLFEEVLSRGDVVDEEEAEAIAAEMREEYAPPPWPGLWSRTFLRVEEVMGYRDSRRAEGGWRAGSRLCRVSMRQDRGHYGGCVEAAGWGPLAGLVAGGIRPRFGEGLVLGTRYSPYTPPRSPGPGIGGVASTSSIWGRKFGAAVSLRAGGYGASAAAWREDDLSEVYWTWLTRGAPGSTFGVAAGARRGSTGKRFDGVDVSFAGVRTSAVGVVAGEVAVFRHRVFAAIRMTVQAGGVWTAELFDAPAPRGYSGGVASPGDETRVRSGGALHRSGRAGGVDTRISLYANVRRTPSETTERRRFDASVRGRTGAYGRWDASLRLLEERESEFSQETIDYRPLVDRRRQAHVRAGWTGGDGIIRQRYRVSVRLDEPGAVGVVGVVGLTAFCHGQEAGFQVSNYSMASGQTGYVIPTGVGGPLVVSAVSRTGSSLSARIRLKWRGLRLAWYWSQPWQKPPRSHVSAAVSL